MLDSTDDSRKFYVEFDETEMEMIMFTIDNSMLTYDTCDQSTAMFVSSNIDRIH
jgi:hypothetical protein